MLEHDPAKRVPVVREDHALSNWRRAHGGARMLPRRERLGQAACTSARAVASNVAGV